MLSGIKFFNKTSKKLIWAVIFLITFFCMLEIANQPSSASQIAWVFPSLERIERTKKPDSKTSIQLYAARGEYESFQIGIISPKDGLTNVNISTSDLSGPNNQVISKQNITLYREHYIRVNHSSPKGMISSNPPLGTGWYADGLIPFVHPETQADLTGAKLDAVPFNLSAGSNQPIWVDVFVPRDTQPGQYRGTFTVTSNQGNITGEILLKVWNFQLPLKPSLNSGFSFYEIKSKSAMVEMLKHKLMPVANINPADQRQLIDLWGLRSFRLPFWSGADYTNCKMKPAPSIEDIKSAAAKHESDLFQYVRYADEIDKCPNLIAPMKEWARNIHKAGLATAIAMTPTPELYDDGSGIGRSAVDIWIVKASDYDQAPKRVSEVLQKGDKVWFYTALAPAVDDYSPKWLIDFAPINFRIPHGFINQSLGLTGVLYWRVDSWTGDPWNDEQTLFQGGHYYPGEGMLFYPGEKVGVKGVVPSMRLKWLRDGVEDYEYIEILKSLGRGDWALEVSRTAGKDWKNWTRDWKVLESVRQQLGQEIERLQS
jgi:hypothetical protein